MSKDDRSVPTQAPGQKPAPKSAHDEVSAFLAKVAATPSPRTGQRGRLIFAMDATASREPTWDTACQIQAEMFKETADLGGLDLQLVFFRGFGECKASKWMCDSATLLRRMTSVRCMGGHTQIAKVLKHCVKETKAQKVNALVYVGDHMEESVDQLCHQAGELGVLGVPVFLFHEGGEPSAAMAFRQIARLSGGAYCPFDSGSAAQLRDLLSAVAVFAAGGRPALSDFSKRRGGKVLQLTNQVKGAAAG
ncbi:MAG: VWA domain-containing protein [Alphaproteobacteria bacterium]|nr:VWA domain-containing protein [Alphaproteobacteria bacterium]